MSGLSDVAVAFADEVTVAEHTYEPEAAEPTEEVVPTPTAVPTSEPTAAPATEAPKIAAMELISSSIWIKTPPCFGSRMLACSAISVEGVMG